MAALADGAPLVEERFQFGESSRVAWIRQPVSSNISIGISQCSGRSMRFVFFLQALFESPCAFSGKFSTASISATVTRLGERAAQFAILQPVRIASSMAWQTRPETRHIQSSRL